MKLSELKKITNIDLTIKEKQRELSELYIRRAKLLNQESSLPEDTLMSEMSDEFLAHSMYEELGSVWQKYGIELPSLRTLKQRLIKSREVITELETALPECIGQFQVIVVPPTKKLSLPITEHMRTVQLRGKTRSKKIAADDVMDASLFRFAQRKSWEVMVVLASNAGLHRGQPLKILNDRSYMAGKYNTRKLGVTEYAALTLSVGAPIDTSTNTMLLKNFTAHAGVPLVRFRQDHYHFDVDTTGISGLFGDDRFRPAVEIA